MPTLVSTGQITLTDVTDGLNARLSSESHLIPTDSNGENGDYAGCSTTLSVFLGKTDDTANWSFSASPTAGITGSLVGSTYTVTGMTTDAGYVDLTASRQGYASLTSRFSITKAKRGHAGPAITLVSSAQGFVFRDNLPFPTNQSIAFTVIRQNAYGPVQFYASNGVSLTTDAGQLLLSNYTLGVHGVGEGETCYLDLAQFGDNQQVTITAVVGEQTATQTIVRLDSSTAEAGATVGAPAGTLVGGQLAEQLVSDAATAKLGAETANNLLADIASDSKLTATEKQQVKLEWDVIAAEKAGINAQATAFGITTENASYNSAYDALNTYVTPLLSSLTTTSDIAGSTFRTNFSNLYSARQALLNKIAEVAATRSNWTSVSGKPTDEQIMNVLVPQGVYNGVPLPFAGRSLYIPCFVNNDSGTAGWFRVAELKMNAGYHTGNFLGAIYWGQSGKRFNKRADIKAFLETGGTASGLSNYGYTFAGDDPSATLKFRRYQDVDNAWKLGVFVYLNAWGSALLDGNWYASSVSGSWIDDLVTQADVLAGDPGYIDLVPVADYVLGANNTYVDGSGNIQGVSSGSGQSVANNMNSVIRAPGGGVFTTSNATMTGRLKITLPQSWTSTMMRFTVEIYEYVTGYSCTLEISGYNYSSGSWLQVSAAVLGGSNVEYPVYFGHDGTKCCIWIGATTGETWSYPQVRVRDWFGGFSNFSRAQWESGWVIGFDTTAITAGSGTNQYSASVLDTLPGANWAKVSGANKPADNASVATPSLGIKINQIDWSTANPGECWLHGYDKNGTAIPAAGWVSVNGVKHTVPYGKPLYTQQPSTSGFIMLDTAGETFVPDGFPGVACAFVRCINGQWAYDNNTGWVNFTPSSTHFVIGTLQTGASPDSVLSASVWGYGIVPSTVAEVGATRNIHRGNWATATAYAVGDTVIHGGYGWSCVLAHTSASGTNNPPTYPTTSNTWWTLAAVKGEDAKTAMLTASSFVFKVAQDGTVSPASIALAAVGQNLAGSPTFTVTSGVATLTGTGEARVLNAASLTSDQATIKITWDGKEDFVTITKVREGTNALSVVMSNEAHAMPAGSNGTVSSYTGSGTAIQVYEGGTALTASASLTVSAFRIGTITQTPASTITVGGVSYSSTTATVAQHSAMVAGTDTVTLTIPVTIYRADGSSVTINKVQTITKAKTGVDGAQGVDGAAAIAAILSNEAHVFPAANDGTVSSYVGSGTTVAVYEGAAQLVYDGVGTANGTWKVATSTSNITVGALTDSGTYLTVGDHSGVASGTDTSSVTFTITGKTAAGTAFSITKQQSFTKSKAGTIGVDGAPGPQGPAVSVAADRATTFTATDGTLDGSQANIVFTASVSGISSPTYVWTFSGFQTAPTNSGTSTQTITAAQFGTAKSATVTCTVNGTYVDRVTIVRLEKSTAEAGATKNIIFRQSTAPTGPTQGDIWIDTSVTPNVSKIYISGVWQLSATVGATFDTGNPGTIDGQITSENASTYIANAAIGSAQIGSLALVGNFSVKSGLTGQRVEMDANGGRVYDSNNVLRVRWGVW